MELLLLLTGEDVSQRLTMASHHEGICPYSVNLFTYIGKLTAERFDYNNEIDKGDD